MKARVASRTIAAAFLTLLQFRRKKPAEGRNRICACRTHTVGSIWQQSLRARVRACDEKRHNREQPEREAVQALVLRIDRTQRGEHHSRLLQRTAVGKLWGR